MKKGKIKTIVLLIIGLLGIMDTIIVRVFVQGMDLGTMLPAIIGILFIIFSMKPMWEKYIQKVHPILLRVVYWGFLLFLTVFIITEGCIILGSVYTPEPQLQPKYVVVLGAGIKEDGSPTVSLRNRLESGIDYAAKYPDTTIVVSGGQGRNEPMPEAKAMAMYLENRGVESDRIIIEDRSTSTMENFKYTKEIIGAQEEIAFITNDFHVFRATILAGRNDFKAYGYGTTTPAIVLVNSYLREFFALVKSMLVDY